MAIPNFQETMLPILEVVSGGGVHAWHELRDVCAKLFEATDEELAERLSSGGSRFDSRVQWALTHLVQGGLLTRPRRGHVQITDRGKEVLAAKSDRVDTQLLSRFEEYREFRMRTRAGSGEQAADAVGSQGGGHNSPIEAIAEAVRESNEAPATDVLQRVLDQKPVFLEQLVLDLLTAMGYGGRAGAAEHWGRSDDGGIDGVVRQDVLGLDRVYVQAKRYAADQAVGRPDRGLSALYMVSRLTGVCSSRRAGSARRRAPMSSASPTGSCSSTVAGWPS
ncbi:MAG: restriction endonuclease [Pseudonocardiales bacterium]|nr:restriction endonuclease [Pseudonocardiales bacterium]